MACASDHPGLAACRAALLDTGDLMCDAADALIDDSFFRCFTSAPPDPWNWTWYLFPQWCLGVVLRYFILFPLRLALVLAGMCLGLTAFFSVHSALKVRIQRAWHCSHAVKRWLLASCDRSARCGCRAWLCTKGR